MTIRDEGGDKVRETRMVGRKTRARAVLLIVTSTRHCMSEKKTASICSAYAESE